MPTVKIENLGDRGLNIDIPPFRIGVNELSFGKNIRASRGRLENFPGYTVQTTAPIEPHGLFAFTKPDRAWLWMEAGLNEVYVYDGTTHYNITRASGNYVLNEDISRWTGGTIAGIGFLCPGTEDYPQVWADFNPLTLLVDMTYDPTQAPGARTWADLNYRAYAMRSFKSTILALNVARGATVLPATVQWCDFLAPGDTEPDFVPRTTNSAGEFPLTETTGNIIDGAPLRDDFIIYKEDSAYRMSFTGDANDPFEFSRLPDYTRILNRNCIGVANEFHILVSRDDVQVFDGNQFRSILEHRMREYYLTRLNADRQAQAFVAVLNSEMEVWICYPTTEGGLTAVPTEAIVWNWHDDTISITDLPGCRDMDEGIIVEPQTDTFDDNGLTFDEDVLRFDQTPFELNRAFLVGAHGTSVSAFGDSNTEDGTPRECFAERAGLVLADGGGQSIQRVHTLRTFKPYLQSTGPVQIRIGAQATPTGNINWEPFQTFDPNTQDEINSRATGRFFAYRIRSNADVKWRLTDAELEYKLRRRR